MNKIYNIDILKGIKKINSNSCDIIIADPPYNIGKDFGNNSDKRSFKDYLIWCDSWINECLRVLKPDGTLFIYGFSEILAYIFVRIPVHKRWLVWHYINKNMPSVKFWQRSHESIIACWKGNVPRFNIDLVRVPYTKSFIKSSGKIRPATKSRFYKNGNKATVYNANPLGAMPRDVIDIPALAGGAGFRERVNHPTQKPLALCDILIKSAKPKKGGLILVPFAGSGSECVAAKLNKINFIGFEINPKYVKLSEKRVKNKIVLN